MYIEIFNRYEWRVYSFSNEQNELFKNLLAFRSGFITKQPVYLVWYAQIRTIWF